MRTRHHAGLERPCRWRSRRTAPEPTWAPNQGVVVIDTATHAVVATIPFVAGVDGMPNAVVTSPPPPPIAPSNLRATVTGNRVSLTWDASPSDGLSGYVLEGGVTPGSVLAALPTGSTAPTFTFDAPTGAFFVRMRALRAGRRSPASNEIQIFVNIPQVPSAPTGSAGSRRWRQPRPQLESRVGRWDADVVRPRCQRGVDLVGAASAERDVLVRRRPRRHLYVRRARGQQRGHQPGVVAGHAHASRARVPVHRRRRRVSSCHARARS